MSGREYWQSYRKKLSARIKLARAGLENRFGVLDDAAAFNSRLCHGSIQGIQMMRDEEEHLAAVERLLAGNGQLE